MSGHLTPGRPLGDYVDSLLQTSAPGNGPLGTGLPHLDALLSGGLRPGETMLVAGLPGAGTSVFALGLVRAAVLTQRLPTLLLSEDPEVETWCRIVSAHTKVVVQHLREHKLTAAERERVEAHRTELDGAPLKVEAGPAVFEAAESRLAEARADGVRLVVIDAGGGIDQLSRPTARRLSSVARTFQLPIVIAARVPIAGPRPDTLRRACAAHPGAADLDVVVGLDRDDIHQLDSDRPGECDLAVLRNRWGPTGTVTVALQGHYARLVTMTAP